MRKLSSFIKNDNLTIKTNTIMTQVKLFREDYSHCLEEQVNQFLQEKASTIKVIDIKYTVVDTFSAHSKTWTVMVIYETL